MFSGDTNMEVNILEKKHSINEKKRDMFNSFASSSGIPMWEMSRDRKEVDSKEDQKETGRNRFFLPM